MAKKTKQKNLQFLACSCRVTRKTFFFVIFWPRGENTNKVKRRTSAGAAAASGCQRVVACVSFGIGVAQTFAKDDGDKKG